MLGIALEGGERVARGRGPCGQAGVDVDQRVMAVDLRLAGAEQVEVGAVQDEDRGHDAGAGREGKVHSLPSLESSV